jgi:rod shape determining protein RodA
MSNWLALLWPRRGDKRLVLVFIALCLYSLVVLWSVTEPIRGPYEHFEPDVPKSIFYRQIAWIAVGWMVLLVGARLPLRHLEELSPLFYAGVALALAVVLAAAPVVAGARRWFAFGPIRLQPAEPAKICLILMLARVLSLELETRRQLRTLAVTGGLTLLLFVLVLREPDLGTALAYPAIWLGMVFWYGVSWVILLTVGSPILSAVISFYSESVVHSAWPWGIYLLLLIGLLYAGRFRILESGLLLLGNVATGLGIPFLWSGLKPYQQDRVLTFFDPSRDTAGAGYQIIQSKVAIGSGGFFGAHYLQGTQKGLAFLPERHTDFIFSVVGEELGMIGALLLLGLFLMLLLRGLDVALSTRRPFASYVAIGCVSCFLFHVIVNVSITTGLLPVTGLPLPLLSYGGSNLLTCAFLLGLLVNIAAHGYET